MSTYINRNFVPSSAVVMNTTNCYTNITPFGHNITGIYYDFARDGYNVYTEERRVNEYGRLVRIPNSWGGEAAIRSADVTVKAARAEAKRLRKLARKIERICAQ